VLLGSGVVPLEVAALRSGVLAALGLVTYLAGLAYRQQRDRAAEGLARAEAVGRQLTYTATHDRLTGLPNREHFLTTLRSAIDAPEVPDVAVG
jgi:hypothetical protein